MTRRVLAMLLAVVMLVGMLPYQVFATELDDSQIVTEATEASVVETTASEETQEPVASESTEEATVAETTVETVVSETTEETAAGETVEQTAEPELETLELEPAEDAVVYVTGANAGVLVKASDGKPMVNKAVTVKDLNSDGVLTYDEALVAAHKAYCPDGYVTAEESYGTAVKKLWGVEAGYNYYFFKNQVALAMNVGDTEQSTVKAGDKLYATILSDGTNCSDMFTYFDAESKTVQAGETVTLTLKGFEGMAFAPETQAISGVRVGTWNNGAFTALTGKTTDENGKVTLSFDKAGTYYVTASGTVKHTASYTGVEVDAPIMAPACVITVEGATTDPSEPEEPAKHYISKLAFGTSYTPPEISLVENSWTYSAEISPSFGSAVYAALTLSEDAPEGATITASYTNTSDKETTATLTSGSKQSLWSLVGFGMKGNTVTFRVGVEGDYQTYTVNIDRPAEVSVKSVTDANDAALPFYESQYLVPESEASVKITANSNGADLTINGQTATSGEAYTFTPAWSEDNTCTVTIAATYGEKSAQQIITLKKLFTTDEFTGSCGENITWKLVNGKLTLTGSGEMTNYKAADVPWYSFMNRIHAVEIGEGITSVGKYAFKAATNLSKVTLPSTLTVLGEECFNGCSALKEVTLPDGLKTLSGRAFCKTGLTSISIPASVDSVSYYVFNGCTDLKTATVTNAMGTNMFSDCLQLENITFAGTSLTSIPSCAIANCAALKTLVIPEGVTSIASQSGYNLQSYVQNVTLPNSLTTITTGAFSTELVNITIKDDNPNFVKDGKILYTKDYKSMVLCEQDISGEVTFHDGVESIPASAFASNKNITKVTLPETVKSIGNDAFNGCTKLETVVLNEGLESFGANAFYNCYALANINLPSSLTSLGKMAFYACNSLKSVEIPEKVTALPNLLFSNATGLETIILPAGLTKMEARTFFNCEKTLKTIYFRGTPAAWNAVANRPADGTYEVICNYGRTDIASITTQPEDRMFILNSDAAKGLSVTVTKPEGVSIRFAWYVSDTKSTVNGTKLEEGVSISEDGLTSYCAPATTEVGTKYYYCIVTSTLENETVESNSRIAAVEVSAKLWEGEGTETSPFQLANGEDVQKLYTYVAEGSSTTGKYFAVTGEITLPEGWVPIGTEKNRFAGIIDGYIDEKTNGTIIVPEGGKPLLGYVLNATVKNLNIKGSQIDGYGLIDNFVGINITSETVIDNVTIKSGTKILQSGLLGTYTTTNIYAGCSATYRATIRNCTVEENVVIGYNKDQSKIGSLAGRFCGTVENCVSYATVYGVDYVGGLVGNQDNAMGSCAITNSQFHGTVEGSGQFAGGIIGGGYEDGTLASAPSGLHPTIKNCTVDGTVTGKESVGGITGGDRLVAQSWNEYFVTGNTFTGTITGSKYVGGIIGYYRSLNKLDNIADNSYSGAERGIGYVAYLDTSYENPTAFDDTLVFDTGKSISNCPTVQWHSWKMAMNRTDDPLGADADKLCKKLGGEKPKLEIMVNNSYMADKQEPQKAMLGEDNVFRVANRTASANYIWLSVEDGTTVDFTLLRGKSGYFSVYQNKRTNNNVFDGTTYQFYLNNTVTLPMVAKFDVVDANENKATYYLVVDKGEIGAYAIDGDGFTTESTLYDAETGITFTEAGQALTLNPKTRNIGSREDTTAKWKWATSDNHVALVDGNGKVTCVGGGEATITATCDQISITCTVTSTAAEHKIHTYGSDKKCTVCGDRKPSDVTVKFTLIDDTGAYVTANEGKTQLYCAALTVEDQDCDGTITYSDLFNAAHKTYCTAGTEGFATIDTDYGPFITKFWGSETSAVSYYANNAAVNSMNDRVNGNANVVAFFYQDTTGYTDLYTWFDKDSVKTVSGYEKTFTIHGANNQAPKGATVTVLDETGAAVESLTTTVDDAGEFVINFPAAGNYTVWVKGTASYDFWGTPVTEAPVLPSFQIVEVWEPKSAVVYMTIVDDENNFVRTIDGEEVYRYAFRAVDDPENPDGKVTIYEALQQIHAQKCPAGADGFRDSSGFIKYVWGVNTGGWLTYYFDDVWMQGYGATMTGTYDREFVDRLLGTEIHDGVDDYTLYMMQTYGDVYTYFYPREQTAVSGIAQEFTAIGDKSRTAKIPVGASITVTDSQGNVLPELATTVDENGKFSVTFPAAGKYTIDLGNAEKQAYTHSRCFVTVSGVETSKRILRDGETTKLQVRNGNKVEKNVIWTMTQDDEAYVSMTVKNGVATVKALETSEKHLVTITASTPDGELSVTLTILPKAQGVVLNEETVTVDIGGDFSEPVFTATVLPADAKQEVTWTSSNKKVATVENGKVTLTGTLGTAKITATTTDGTKLSASATVNVVKLAQSIVLSGKDSILGGKTATFTATEKDGTAIKASDITWSLSDTTYASVNASGKLTTKAVPETVELIVTATVKGSDRSDSKTITLTPVATYVDILSGEDVVTEKTLTRNIHKEETTLALSAAVYPQGATEDVTWTSSNKKIATVDDGVVTYAGKTGTVTITATAADGSGVKATMKLTFAKQATVVTIDEHETQLRSGGKLKLSASTDLENGKVTWSLKNAADKAYVTLSNGTLKAKTVYEAHVVTLLAMAKDGGATAETTVTILPKSDAVLVLKHGEENVTKTTQNINISADSYTLTAQNVGGEAQDVTWKTSNYRVASLSDTTGSSVTLNLRKAGTATITATASDGSKTTVTVKVTTLVESITITGDNTVASGKSIQLKATAAPATASKKSVTWTVDAGDGAFASINASGKLTAAKNLMQAKTVTVIATAADGSGVVGTREITILPVATEIRIGQADQKVNMQQTQTLQLSAQVYPRTAAQQTKWTSSNAKVATVDETGLVTFHAGGTVTITASTMDGSNKRDTVKLTVVRAVEEILLDNSMVAGGKNVNLGKLVQVGPQDATNRKLVWSIQGETAFASVSSSGLVKTKKVTETKTVYVTATAADGYGAQVTCRIDIYPATTKVALECDGETVTGKTIRLTEGESLQLTGINKPLEAYQDWTWKSSNPNAVEVDENGCVTGLTAGKTVTITCTANDGTGKKATVKIKVIAE